MTTLIDWQKAEVEGVESYAANLLNALNFELQRRAGEQNHLTGCFRHSKFSPKDIIAAMGKRAGIFVTVSRLSTEHVAEIAALGGKGAADFLDAEAYAPPDTAEIAPDGSVVLKPKAK